MTANCVTFSRASGGLIDQLSDSPHIAEDVFRIALRTLHLPPISGPDEGSLDGIPGHYWRRVVSRADAAAMAAGTHAYEDDPRASWNYILVYRAASDQESAEAGCVNAPGIFLVGVYYSGELIRHIGTLMSQSRRDET